MDNYTEGIAFILEGATEKVFYKAYLEYLSALDEKTSLIRNKLTDDGEIIFCWQSGEKKILATVYKGNIIKNLIMDCQSYTKYRPNETTGGIFVSWRRKEELPTGA